MRRRHVVLRAAFSIGLLAGLAWWLDLGPVVLRLAQMRLGWVLLAVAISVVQVAVLAWRWRFTAGCLGVDLSYTAAWREYYLSIFLNQVMPGDRRGCRRASGSRPGRPCGPSSSSGCRPRR